MDFDDLIMAKVPPPNRIGKADCEFEHHLYEGAVMIAYAMHLFERNLPKKFEFILMVSMVSNLISLVG